MAGGEGLLFRKLPALNLGPGPNTRPSPRRTDGLRPRPHGSELAARLVGQGEGTSCCELLIALERQTAAGQVADKIVAAIARIEKGLPVREKAA
jgi:hypothetical protein